MKKILIPLCLQVLYFQAATLKFESIQTSEPNTFIRSELTDDRTADDLKHKLEEFHQMIVIKTITVCIQRKNCPYKTYKTINLTDKKYKTIHLKRFNFAKMSDNHIFLIVE